MQISARVLLLMLLLAGAVANTGCGSHKGQVADTVSHPIGNPAINKVYDSLKADLAGAAFSAPFLLRRELTFTEAGSPDTFELWVPAGLIAHSRGKFSVTGHNGKQLFADSFATAFFALGVFEPDTVPEGGQDAYEKYMIGYMRTLTAQQIAVYTQKQLRDFMNELKPQREAIDDKEMVEDSVAYRAYLADPKLLAFYLPCFDCDEGGMLYCYYKPKDTVLLIGKTD